MLEEFIKNNKIPVVCAVVLLLLAAFLLPGIAKVPKNTTPVDDLLVLSGPARYDDLDIYVDISGAVKDPGVYKLKPGARMTDLVKACGGFRTNALTTNLNLAQTLKDGDKIVVPSLYRCGTASGVPFEDRKVNINTADQKALESIPGIGPGTAKKILEYRSSQGLFGMPEDMKKVKGISASKFEKLKQYIDVH